MNAMVLIVGAALVVEGLVQILKGFVPEQTNVPSWLWPVTSACIGVLLCVLGNIDLLVAAGLTLSVPGVGAVMTGFMISRGASFVHDWWGKFQGQKVTGVPEGTDKQGE